MYPAIVSGIVTRNAPVSYWLNFFPVPGNSPRSLAKVNSSLFPSGEFVSRVQTSRSSISELGETKLELIFTSMVLNFKGL